MAQPELHLANATVVLPGSAPARADLLIGGGRILHVGPVGEGVAAHETVDLSGLTVMPGAVDVHLHLGHGNDISRPRTPEDAARETAAAALGGVTTFIPYIMGAKPYGPDFEALVAVTEAGARIDFGFHFIVATEGQLAELPRYVQEFGAPSIKYFMNLRGNEGDRLGLPPTDDGFLWRLLEGLRDCGGMLCPHPENIEVAWALRDRLMAADPDGRGGLATWNAMRPPVIEAEAIRRAAYFARGMAVPVYCVHTSSAEALREAMAERAAGGQVYIETCNHYLTHDETSNIGARGKINPPLRRAADREALWAALSDGGIDTVGTDHVHRSLAAKDGGLWKASPGCPGLDTYLPVLVSEGHHRRGIPLQRIAEVTAETPARVMGMGERKGRIAAGMDADLAIVDLDAQWQVTPDDLATSAGYSIYEGQAMRGRVVHTLSRGRFVLRDGQLAADAAGHGRYQRRTLPG